MMVYYYVLCLCYGLASSTFKLALLLRDRAVPGWRCMGVVGWGLLYYFVSFWLSRFDIPCMVYLLSGVFVSWLRLFLPSAEIVPYEGTWHLTGIYLSGGR